MAHICDRGGKESGSYILTCPTWTGYAWTARARKKSIRSSNKPVKRRSKRSAAEILIFPGVRWHEPKAQ